MNKKSTIILIAIAFAFTLSAQELVTDRPDQTESSSTIPKRSLQIESGITIERQSKDDMLSFLLPTTLLRYGLTEKIELRLGEQIMYNTLEKSSKEYFGLSDLELGAKFQILKNESGNSEIAFLSHLVVPTGSNNFSNEKVGTINKLAISHSINNRLDFGYNIGYDYFGKGIGNLTYSAALGIGVTDKIGTYVELFGEIPEFEDFEASFDSGVTYLIKKNLQLDFSFGIGITERIDYLALGVSWRIDRK